MSYVTRVRRTLASCARPECPLRPCDMRGQFTTSSCSTHYDRPTPPRRPSVKPSPRCGTPSERTAACRSEPEQLGKPNVALSRRYPPPRHREPVADGREQAPNVTMDGRPWDQVVSIQRQPSASEHSCHSRVEPSKDQQQRRELVQSPELDIDNDRYPARIASRRQRARLQ